MKFDLNQLILNLDDKPVKVEVDNEDDPSTPKLADLTIRKAIQVALTRPVMGDDKLTEEQKHRLWRLAKRTRGDVASFDAKDITTILERVHKSWPSAVIYGQVKEALDPSDEDNVVKPNGSAGVEAQH